MAFKFLNEVTESIVSEIQEFTKLVKDHSVQVVVTNATTLTALEIDLEGSLDGKTFFKLENHVFDGAELTDRKALFHVSDTTVRFVRMELVLLTGTGTPTVTALYEPFENRS